MAILLGWVLLIYGGLTFLIVKKKDYTFISGFSNRPKEEQERLIQSGFIEALGKLLVMTFFLFVITYVFWLLSVPHSLEIGFSVFTVALLGGMMWIQRFEVKKKRKKMFWITGSISIGTLLFIVGLNLVGMQENDVRVDETTLTVTGMYGVEWELADIQSVELLEELPEVIMRTNGFSLANYLKGRFRLEKPYGGGLLFIQKKSPPYMYVVTEDDYFILNRKQANETRELYATLQSKIIAEE